MLAVMLVCLLMVSGYSNVHEISTGTFFSAFAGTTVRKKHFPVSRKMGKQNL